MVRKKDIFWYIVFVLLTWLVFMAIGHFFLHRFSYRVIGVIVFIGICIWRKGNIDECKTVIIGRKGTSDERAAEHINDEVVSVDFCDVRTLNEYKQIKFKIHPSRIIYFIHCRSDLGKVNRILKCYPRVKIIALADEEICNRQDFDKGITVRMVDYGELKIGKIPKLIGGIL